MYYIRISSDDANKLIYYCRNCGHEDNNLNVDNINISNIQVKNEVIQPKTGNIQVKIEKLSNECYIIDSFSNKNDSYLVNKLLNVCTCKAYKFCKKEIKTCKHIEYLTKFNSNQLNNCLTYDLGLKSCSCNDFLLKYNCKHLKLFKNIDMNLV
jgi:hypothetical protein